MLQMSHLPIITHKMGKKLQPRVSNDGHLKLRNYPLLKIRKIPLNMP